MGHSGADPVVDQPERPATLFLFPMESTDDHAFAQNVSVHRVEYISARGIGRQLEFDIQGEKLPRIVMMRSGGTSAGPEVTDGIAEVFGLNGAVRQLGIRGHA